MSQTVPPAPADRLALIIEGLCHAVARRCGLAGPRLAGPFIILIWSRLRRIKTRFARHAATPVSCRPQSVIATPSEARGKQSRGCPTRERPKSGSSLLLPRRSAWLIRLVPEAASGAAQLRHFLADPEVAILLAATPQLGRILRPLCHMLGIRPTQALHPPAAPTPDAAPSRRPIPSHAPKQAAPVAVPLRTTPPLFSRAVPSAPA